MNYKIIQQTFVKVAKVLRFCGPPLKMKRGVDDSKTCNRMNESSHQSIFDVSL